MSLRIARHLNESLRCVVRHCIVDQTAEVRRDLKLQVHALRTLVEGAHCDGDGAQSSYDDKSCSVHDSGDSENEAFSDSVLCQEVPAKASRHMTSLSCPDPRKRRPSLKSVHVKLRAKKAQWAADHDRLHCSESIHSSQQPSPVGMFPSAVRSVGSKRMSMKRLESRLVSDLFDAKSLHSEPERKDARAEVHTNPKSKVKTRKVFSDDLSHQSDSEPKCAIVPSQQPHQQLEKTNDNADGQASVIGRRADGAAHDDGNDESFSLFPNVVQDVDEVRLTSEQKAKSDDRLHGDNNEVDPPELRSQSVKVVKSSKSSKRMAALRSDRQEELIGAFNKDINDDQFDNLLSDGSENSELTGVQSCIQRVGNALVQVLTGASGVKDCKSSRKPFVIVFQLLILAAALLSFVQSLQQAGFIRWRDSDTTESASSLSIFSDVALAGGAILGLLASGCLQLFTAMTEFGVILRNFSRRKQFEKEWMQHARWDSIVCLTCWALAVTERTRALFFLREGATFGQEMALSVVSFAVSSFLLMSQLFNVLHVCHGMHIMMDDFCFSVVKTWDLRIAEQDWNLVQSLLRKGCASLQFLFVILQSTMVAAVTLAVADIIDEKVRVTELIACGIILCGLAQMFLHASAVTEFCTRLPAFVNSLHFGRDHDPDRMYLVEYIVYSKAGFYIFEVRLTPELVMKFLYAISMALFGVATKVVTGV
eukprot:TRINITY_DN21170_c0_g3_i2.p1 TRINITY_DN21170_c0_g3~~TRINITY_DN21170_c0_g3_i2.p1  ORF type:complete len:806 (-),score=128.27 TRINITY_DN21170_c0_g3_i2:174-2291(-)